MARFRDKRDSHGSDRHHRRQRPVRDGRTRRPRGSSVETPFGDPSAPTSRHARRAARGVPRAPRPRPPAAAVRTQLPGQHLRHQGARRGADPVGSRRRQPQGDIAPLHIVIPDQFIDRTRGRSPRSSGDGLVAHVGFADPVCPLLSSAPRRSAGAGRGPRSRRAAPTCAWRGRVLDAGRVAALPQLGRRRDRHDQLPEAKLAREAEICYATMALVTDYDCWHPDHDSVTVEQVHRDHEEEREDGAAGHRRGRRPRLPVAADLRVRPRARAPPSSPRPELIPEQVKRDLAPIIGKIHQLGAGSGVRGVSGSRVRRFGFVGSQVRRFVATVSREGVGWLASGQVLQQPAVGPGCSGS